MTHLKNNTVVSDRPLLNKSICVQRRQSEKHDVEDVTEIRLRGLKGSKLELRVTSLRAKTLTPMKLEDRVLLPEKCIVNTAQDSALPDSDIISSKCTNEILTEHAAKDDHGNCSLQQFIKIGDRNDRQTKYSFENKLHQIKDYTDNRKQAIKTSLVFIGLEDVKVDNKKHREMLRPHLIEPKYPFNQSSFSDVGKVELRTSDENQDHNIPEVQGSNTRKQNSILTVVEDSAKTLVSVTPLIFTPPSNHKVPSSYSTSMRSDPTSPNNSTVSATNRKSNMPDKQISGNLTSISSQQTTNRRTSRNQTHTPICVKTVLLEVFSEMREMKVQQNISVGQISSSLAIPAYK